jgi:hypothetical protein
LLTEADRVLATVVYLCQICSMNVLSNLLGVNANSIGPAIVNTRQLLAEHGRTVATTTLRFATADALTAFVSGSGQEPGRPRPPGSASAPEALQGRRRHRPAGAGEPVGRRAAAASHPTSAPWRGRR